MHHESKYMRGDPPNTDIYLFWVHRSYLHPVEVGDTVDFRGTMGRVVRKVSSKEYAQWALSHNPSLLKTLPSIRDFCEIVFD